MIVAIDGPAASGKSTTAQVVAEKSGFIFMDSGMMYRAVAFGFLKHEVECTEESASAYLSQMQFDASCVKSEMRIYIDGDDVTSQLPTPKVSAMSSQVAALKCVRSCLFSVQRGFAERFGKDPGIVVIGRDMGTVVFPNADLKFFLTASLDVRARRRIKDLRLTGADISFQEVYDAIEQRDQRDSSRKIAPLRQANDAILINTDQLTIEHQVQFMLDHIQER